ncbi:MAG: branched-chain amino acid ABC transporter permease [Rhodospirillaceae bacterium]|nr:branched-chain amino acid ABC transporter permease [Rhodospirillaceae bacterium]
MIQVIVDGVVNASFVALGVVGLSLVYNILNFPSFAQGDYVSVGAYMAMLLVALFGTVGSIAGLTFGWPMIVAAFGAVVLTALVAEILDRTVFGRLRRQGSSRITMIMASFGVALMLRNLIVIFAGADPLYYAFAIQTALEIGPVRITPNELIVVIVTAAMVFALHLLMSRTRLGKSMRAVSESPTLARVAGIDVTRVIRWTWAIGAGLAAVAGVLFGLAVQLQPYLGFELLLPMFAALILGGVTNIYGAVLGALLIGLAESFTVRYFLPEYRQAVSFVVVIMVLMVRPQGILGERT